ncbi:MAG: putative toxin-antitoxin system toxin component, PIN family [Gammaproteobacteria bacterium]|nr:putative toxin-antitoxin system toxin component, PIN family [Gammaproteobacteria bacterium]
MRIVLDTNTVISALLWRGTPHEFVAAASTRPIVFFTSPALLAELADILTRKKLAPAVTASGLSPNELMQRYRRLATVIHSDPIPPTVVSDPDDDHVIACAITAKTHMIVSGDRDLLDLKEHQSIRIVTSAQALQIITETNK